MSGAAILLALASVVRPTSLAAVSALLVSARPRRLLVAYILAGFVLSVVIGVLVVSLLHQLATRHPTSHAWFELGLGVIALAAAAFLVIRERKHPRKADSRPDKGEGSIATRLHNPTIVGAATIGILTHAPGATYLAALDAIIETRPHFVDGVVQVLVYNLIWFAVPIAALILSTVDLNDAQERIESVGSWTRRHERLIGPLLFVAVGVYLVVKALVKLL